MSDTNSLSAQEQQELLKTLQSRFKKNRFLPEKITWNRISKKLESFPDKLWSLHAMEESGGEPDVVGLDENTGEYLFYDCSAESPAGRRSLCFDAAALAARKKDKPRGSAQDMANEMGIRILTEAEYRYLQTLGKFDTKTSSWMATPDNIRSLGGALFGDRRYDHVFTYHNGVESYYASRGFRGVLRV